MNENLKKIKQLRKEGKTYQQIGDKIGLSRQRIHQIYRDGKINQSKKRVELKCPICKIKFSVTHSAIKKGRKYCSYKCYSSTHKKYKTETERKESIRIQHITYHKRWYEKLKKDTVRYARHLKNQREYQKNRNKCLTKVVDN